MQSFGLYKFIWTEIAGKLSLRHKWDTSKYKTLSIIYFAYMNDKINAKISFVFPTIGVLNWFQFFLLFLYWYTSSNLFLCVYYIWQSTSWYYLYLIEIYMEVIAKYKSFSVARIATHKSGLIWFYKGVKGVNKLNANNEV